jgi:hypothetical protein
MNTKPSIPSEVEGRTDFTAPKEVRVSTSLDMDGLGVSEC